MFLLGLLSEHGKNCPERHKILLYLILGDVAHNGKKTLPAAAAIA